MTVTVLTPITLEITSPNHGETIYRPDILVKGTITNSEGNETGVTVNGMSSIVIGGQFVANHVPLEEGENIITAIATDTEGYTATASITVYAETTGDYIKLTADTESGVSPLEVTLRIEATFSFTESSLTYTGPGDVETLDSTAYEYRVRMTTEGIYYFTAEVNHESNTYTDTIAIEVMDEAALDGLLRARWNGMRQALIQNDIDTAVSYFTNSSKGSYQEMFSALSSDLSQIEQELGDIQFIKIMNSSVEYDIRITRHGEEYSFYLLFLRDEDGLWKIRSF